MAVRRWYLGFCRGVFFVETPYALDGDMLAEWLFLFFWVVCPWRVRQIIINNFGCCL